MILIYALSMIGNTADLIDLPIQEWNIRSDTDNDKEHMIRNPKNQQKH